jgi:putative transposase
MPNHVHLIAVPEAEDSLRSAIGEANRRYAQRVNDRQGWRGHLWQERFASFPMDENHLLAAVRHVELNPVRARLASDAESYPWSSAAAHMAGRGDGVVNVAPLVEIVEEWGDFLSCEPSDEELDALRRHERTGRPLGGEGFVKGLEEAMGRLFSPRKRGRKPIRGYTPAGRVPN